MIRILITAILYLISFFTQAQQGSNDKYNMGHAERRVTEDHAIRDEAHNTFSLKPLDSIRNDVAKFEVTDKHLTFETK